MRRVGHVLLTLRTRLMRMITLNICKRWVRFHRRALDPPNKSLNRMVETKIMIKANLMEEPVVPMAFFSESDMNVWGFK